MNFIRARFAFFMQHYDGRNNIEKRCLYVRSLKTGKSMEHRGTSCIASFISCIKALRHEQEYEIATDADNDEIIYDSIRTLGEKEMRSANTIDVNRIKKDIGQRQKRVSKRSFFLSFFLSFFISFFLSFFRSFVLLFFCSFILSFIFNLKVLFSQKSLRF